MSTPQKLSDYPVHLGLGATCTVQSEFTGTEDWYAAYGQRTEGDDAWEMHPHGAEMVLCIAGTVTLIQEGRATAAETTTDDHDTTTAAAEVTTKVQLNPGEFIINPPGVWHTADVEEGKETTVVFITAGKDTQIKPRS
jgi:mannose-6-phosphate isomerase-like protein (cupin superfamily)